MIWVRLLRVSICRHRRQWSLCAAVVAAGILAAAVSPAGGRTGGIIFQPASIDVHRTEGDASGAATVGLGIINDTNDVVTIAEMVSSCGCTVPRLVNPVDIPPGAKVSVSIGLSVPNVGDRFSVVAVRIKERVNRNVTSYAIPIRMHGDPQVFLYATEFPTQIEGWIESDRQDLNKDIRNCDNGEGRLAGLATFSSQQ